MFLLKLSQFVPLFVKKRLRNKRGPIPKLIENGEWSEERSNNGVEIILPRATPFVIGKSSRSGNLEISGGPVRDCPDDEKSKFKPFFQV